MSEKEHFNKLFVLWKQKHFELKISIKRFFPEFFKELLETKFTNLIVFVKSAMGNFKSANCFFSRVVV